MATSTIFNFNFNNSEIVDSTGQWYNATTGTPTTEFIEHDGNTALLQRAYVAETSYTRDINPVFFQSRDPTFTAHTYTIELQIYPLRDSGGFGPETGPVLDFNPATNDAESRVQLRTIQYGSASNTFYWKERHLGFDGDGIPFLTVTAADGTYNRWYSIRIERVDDGTNTGATVKIYVDGALVVNETLTYAQDARIGRIGDSVRYTYRWNSTSPMGAGAAIDNFKLTAGIAPSSVVDVSLANLQRNNANLLSFIKGKVPAVNDGTLTIQKNGTNVATFTANQSTAATANITVPTKTSDLTNDSGFITSDDTKIPLAGSNQISGSLIPATDNAIDIGSSTKNIKTLYTKGITIDGAQFLPSDYLPKTTALESLSTNSIPFHNAYPRCKYLGTTITDAQNTAIKNRTYDDLFIGDYWTINGVNWRIVAIDYYYNVGDTNFDKGNVVVMPDTVLYNAQMNETNTTAGAYAGSSMRTQNLNNARTIAQNAFGSHLANHRIMLTNAVDASGPSDWGWYDSDGVELPNEVQIYGTRVWGSALKGFDVATQKQQFPLLALAPQFVNTRQTYWLQDVSSSFVSSTFTRVTSDGVAADSYASGSLGVRPSVALSYI